MSRAQAKAWICTVCGYIHSGEELPQECPECGVGRELFKSYANSSNVNQEHIKPTVARYAIIGAGIAGVSAAEAIRKADPEGSILLLSSEHELPYFRMSLTRYLAGEVTEDKLDLHPESWYAQNHIDLHINTRVVEISPVNKTLLLENGSQVTYDKLILAAGASPFVPPFRGSDLAGVQTLRTIEDAKAILRACQELIEVVCIGGGLLGLEVAGAIARHGARVTIVESLPWLLPRQLDQSASVILQEKIEAMGIQVVVGAKTQALEGEKQVSGVRLEDGRLLPAALVVISAGVQANVSLARSAGLEVNRGILVDEHMRTSDPDIFAAGDDCEFHGRLYGLWVPARSQGIIAGQVAAGQAAVFPGDPPSAKLKVLGIDLFSIGQFTPQEEEDTLLAETKDGCYASFLLRSGVLVGAILLGDASLATAVKKAVDAKRDFSSQLKEGLNAAGLKVLLE